MLGQLSRGMVDVPLARSKEPRLPYDGPSHTAATYSVDGGIATITLSQPDNKNALSTELVDAVGDHLMSAEADEAVRCVVLTNEGNTFCAGADLKGRATAPPRHSLVDVMVAIIDCPKPVIGRIAGHCTGGGGEGGGGEGGGGGGGGGGSGGGDGGGA